MWGGQTEDAAMKVSILTYLSVMQKLKRRFKFLKKENGKKNGQTVLAKEQKKLPAELLSTKDLKNLYFEIIEPL